ncbi:MAG: pyruvate kinase [Deltaproteobacteria bacterium]|nr:pyruvate kinase [Deltaproteobacteria bacterium]
MATLGPASSDPQVIEQLIQAGVGIFRFNFSHGTHETHRNTIDAVRSATAKLGRHIPIVIDLMGPRYRLGQLPEGGFHLAEGQQVLLGEGTDEVDLPVDAPELMEHLQPGERVLIDNGLVELSILARKGRHVAARVVHGGPVSTRKGINLPDTNLPFQISLKDRQDIAFAVEVGADFIGASYVGHSDHLERLRGVIEAAGGRLPLIAKLERRAAVEQLDSIVDAADAVMVARGDLGVEVPLNQVPVLQKKIIAAGRRSGTPVIVATQMLESMMEQPRPTRAEVSDVANAVFDGADALMLSGETAAGRFPLEAVRTMRSTILEAEGYGRIDAERQSELSGARPGIMDGFEMGSVDTPDAVSAAAAHAAKLLQVKQIVAFSQGGFTARLLARYRPPVPVLVFTTDPAVARRIQLLWGVYPILLDHNPEQHDEVVEIVDRELCAKGFAEPGEVTIILMGAPINERPRTNLMRVHRLQERPKL